MENQNQEDKGLLTKTNCCSNCKHQISYMFHAVCSKGYANCYSDGKYILFERYIPLKNKFFESIKC